MEISFSVFAPKTKQVVIFEFYLSGFLKGIYFNDNAKGSFVIASIYEAPSQITYKPGSIPSEFAGMISAKCEVKDISTIDLTFEKFWEIYCYKRGNIERNKKLWAKLSSHEKILALGFINKLKAVYSREGKELPYPETYIAQHRWENEL